MKKMILWLTACVAILTACDGGKAASNGENLYFERGCASCHARDESYSIGPSWKGLYGSEVRLNDGSTVTADEAYLLESILNPTAKIVEGYAPGAMPSLNLTEAEAEQLVAYIKALR
ncbi:MAG: hypothetical protein Fur0043_24990 [Anaerolineales bacterium]